jgi:hypothetical protein
VRKFQTFTASKDPGLLSTEDVKAFLTSLAVKENVASSTQNQAFNALLFFYRHVLKKEFGQVDGVVRATCFRRITIYEPFRKCSVIAMSGTPGFTRIR